MEKRPGHCDRDYGQDAEQKKLRDIVPAEAGAAGYVTLEALKRLVANELLEAMPAGV